MVDVAAEHLTRRIEHLLELRLMGVFTPADAAELSELYAIERSWRCPDLQRRTFGEGGPGAAQVLHPAGRFQRPVAPPQHGGTPERKCRLCGVPERESHLLRLESSMPTVRPEQFVCDGCIRAAEVSNDAGFNFQRRRGDRSVG
ncbi:MAG: hypothetical protein QOG87_3795 [Actinomycetota bacterium]|jgi:hypothetical protein